MVRVPIVALLSCLPTYAAQQGSPVDPAIAAQSREEQVVVTGKRVRGTAIGDALPVAVLDPEAIRALGAMSISDLVKRLRTPATSITGENSAIVLNGMRISGFDAPPGRRPAAGRRGRAQSQLGQHERGRHHVRRTDLPRRGRRQPHAEGADRPGSPRRPDTARAAEGQRVVRHLGRVEVRSRTGATPNRFQPALPNPPGRVVRIGLRKLF